MPTIGLLFLVLQVGGFVAGAVYGGRVSDKLAQINRWYPLIVAGIIMALFAVCMVVSGGVIANEWVRAIAFTVIAFAGGLVVRARNRIV
jgi:hypothetical protein